MTHTSTANATLLFVALGFVFWAPACSTTATGTGKDDGCTAGVCDPDAVFTRGTMSAFVVAPDAIYAAIEETCAVYAAPKPVRSSQVVATNACTVTSLVATKAGLFWTTSPRRGANDASTSSFAWLPRDATRPIVLEGALHVPRATLAVLGDDVYVTDAAQILLFDAATSRLLPAASVEGPYDPVALRAFDGALYFHDAYATIYAWRPGDATPKAVVEHAGLVGGVGSTDDAAPFVVDASGFYWWSGNAVEGGSLAHAPLTGGAPERFLDLPATVTALATDDTALYWSEVDDPIVPKETRIRRTVKTALGTTSLLASIGSEGRGLAATPEGLYIAAAPSLADFDFEKLGFQRYGGPLLLLPRDVLDAK